jgi:NADPH:quinone reductase
MRALTFDRFGDPAEVLRLGEFPLPEPGRGEVRVRMLAAPVNPSDLMTIRGTYGKQPTLPATPGYEGVGIVDAAGAGGLGWFLRGKRVAVLNSRTGSWAEHAIVAAKQAVMMSSEVPIEQAAMFFVNPAAALIMTRKVLRVPAGEWLLQTAAGSTLGRMVIRLGRKYGFRTINIVRRREQVAELEALGADAVVCESDGPVADEVRRLTGGAGVRYAIDPVGGKTGSAVVDCLGPGGRLLVFGTMSGEPLSFSSRKLMVAGASVEGFWLGNWMARQSLVGKLRLMKSLTNHIRDGVLVSDVAESFPLERFAEAVATAERPGRGGKVLLKLGDP